MKINRNQADENRGSREWRAGIYARRKQTEIGQRQSEMGMLWKCRMNTET